MFYYHITDKNNVVILSNLPKELFVKFERCSSVETFQYKGQKCKHGKIINDDIGLAYLFTSNIDDVNSHRIFKDKLSLYINFIDEIKNIKDEVINNILHDITKINGHCIQELYELIPENVAYERTYKEQLQLLERHINANKRNIAKGLFNINRDVLHLKAECSNLKYLNSKLVNVEKKNHEISKALMPSLHVYMPPLKEKGVQINIDAKLSKEINLNFEYLECAMIPLLDNAVKYILPNSPLYIYFGENIDGFSIVFDMISMQIKKDEKDKIFDRGYSGVNAIKNNVNGKGMGMASIVDSLRINGVELRLNINVNKDAQKRYHETVYERNIFQIVFLSQ